eukprot:502742-Amphidinium_carterae.1
MYMDNMIIRFEETYRRANCEGGMLFNAVALIKTEEHFVNFLSKDFNGVLPFTEAEYSRAQTILRTTPRALAKERTFVGRESITQLSRRQTLVKTSTPSVGKHGRGALG